MPSGRPKIGLDSYKDQVIALVLQKNPIRENHDFVNKERAKVLGILLYNEIVNGDPEWRNMLGND
ncbi:uncharacterized protein N7477_006769 [Penicillium maclennaniae]|uniref:uncharacterized protein n=1 Tax=Penicillium maclennaniae TaxID=1343394 RepID=UPI002541FB90|nr:uncharacterized protein N7477_006769 [Penicillium maclennaniae]KAJ5668199.1 hypothetical protein N7477_006769 [Penicillium maclennaniae]